MLDLGEDGHMGMTKKNEHLLMIVGAVAGVITLVMALKNRNVSTGITYLPDSSSGSSTSSDSSSSSSGSINMNIAGDSGSKMSVTGTKSSSSSGGLWASVGKAFGIGGSKSSSNGSSYSYDVENAGTYSGDLSVSGLDSLASANVLEAFKAIAGTQEDRNRQQQILLAEQGNQAAFIQAAMNGKVKVTPYTPSATLTGAN